ncbi:MAG: tyrosine-type recombinase/integrase [Isosphaeraceae bacterium]
MGNFHQPSRTLPRSQEPTGEDNKPTAGPAPSGPLVKDLVLAYLEHATGYYKGPDGRPTPELQNLIDALRPVLRLYSNLPAVDFGPLSLMAVREEMIRSGLARGTANARIHRVRRCFKWAASVEKIPASVHQGLLTVEALKRGRTDAPESDDVKPVATEVIEATLPHLNRVVAAMVRVQLLTGCRAGDVMTMRGCDLTPGEPNWVYRPEHHKTEWRGKERVIPLGPRAQEIVKQFLKPDTQAYLFDPRDVVAEMHARRGLGRKSRPTPSETARRKAKPGQGHADRYDRRTYRQAIVRACDRAFPHPTLSRKRNLTVEQGRELKAWRKGHRWSPLQIRHTAGTAARARFGLEGAQLLLGHSRADVTQLYAETNMKRAHEIAAEIG